MLSTLVEPVRAGLVAQKMMAALSRPFDLDGKEVFASASIGITLFPADSLDQESLIRNADTAMYRAKEMGRNRVQFYTPEMNARAMEKLNLESSLRYALERGSSCSIQPKRSGAWRVAGWRHSPMACNELGMMSRGTSYHAGRRAIIPRGRVVGRRARNQGVAGAGSSPCPLR